MIVPWLAEFLVRWVCPRDERADLLANLADEAANVAAARGIGPARAWYWSQALLSLLPLLTRRVSLLMAAISHFSIRWSMWNLRSDLSFWLRRVRRRPLVSLTVLATLGGSIAAVMAVFSVGNAVLFKPIPLPDSDRIVRFYTNIPRLGLLGAVNLPDLEDVAKASQTLSAVAPYLPTWMTWQRQPGVESLAAVTVGPSYLDVLGLKLARGRWFDSSEFAVGADGVAVITDGFWRRAFGAREDVLGQVLDLDDRRVRIVGVVERSNFIFPESAELWMPLAIDPSSYLNGRVPVQLAALGRVRGDRSVDTAVAELATVNHGLQVAYPHESGRRSLVMQRLRETLAGPVRPTIFLLIAAVSAVLFLAGANIGDLLLAEAGSRRGEFAVRLALGAGRARLIRQVAVETCALVSLGGTLGLALAPVLTGLLVRSYPTPLPRIAEVGFGPQVLAVWAAAMVVATLLALLPVMRVAGQIGLVGALHEGGRRAVTSGGRGFVAATVVAQVALSVVLVSAATLLARTFLAAAKTDVGFDPQRTLAFNVSFPGGPQENATRSAATFAELGRRLQELPGIRVVGATKFLPFAFGMWGDSFARVGTATDVPPHLPGANIQVITPGLPSALGIALRRGRFFTDHDTSDTAPVVLVNDTLERHWLDGAAIGRRLLWGNRKWEVVGVLAGIKRLSLSEPPVDEIYFPWAQFPITQPAGWIVMRGDDRHALLAMVPTLQAEVATVNPLVPVTRVGLMVDRMTDVMAPERFRAALAGALGTVAVLLALLGVASMLAHRVAAQIREIGVRLALGEPATRVRRGVVLSGVRLSLMGVLAGLMLVWWTAPLLQRFLTTGLRPIDPTTLTVVSMGLLLVATAAAWVPATRASHVDPLVALRAE
jgi:putative ABC transport system permease protein